MQWRNHQQGYGVITIALHWLLAIGLIGLFMLGIWMVDLDYYSSWYHRAPELHKSIGVILVGLMLLRLIWRYSNPIPKAISDIPWQRKLAESVHQLFYLLVLILGISGYLLSTAEGHAIVVFDSIQITALPWQFDNQGDIAKEIHEIAAWSLAAMVLLHTFAALKHHFIDKDKTLKRILRPGQGDKQ